MPGPPIPRDAPVPTPSLSVLPSMVQTVKQRRSPEAEEQRWVETCHHRANLWLQKAPEFVLPNVNLEDLEKAPKNSTKEISKVEAKMKKMKAWPTDASSGRFYDDQGTLMLAVFADQILSVTTFFCFSLCLVQI
jgi:hypothetical protein